MEPSKKISPRIKVLLVGLLMGGLGALSGWGVVSLFPMSTLAGEHLRGQFVLVALGVMVSLWVVVALHELGHVLAGRSQGLQFVMMAVGLLWVERVHGKLVVKLNRLPSTWGGLALCLPSGSRLEARQVAIMAAAGPATSLAVTLVAAAGLALIPATSPATALLRVMLLVGGMASGFIFVATGFMPSIAGGYANDGERARKLLRGDAGALAESALLSLTGLSMASVRPRDFPPALVEAALSTPEVRPMIRATALLFASSVALDRGDDAEALAHTRSFLELMPEMPALARPGFATHAAMVLGRSGEVARARELLEQARGAPLLDAHSVLLSEATVELAAGNREGAAQRAREGLQAVPRARFGASAADREWLEGVLERAS